MNMNTQTHDTVHVKSYQASENNERYFGMRKEDREDSEQIHRHEMDWAEFWSDKVLLVGLAVGGVCLAIQSEESTLHAAGVSVFSGVAGAIIRSFGINNTKNIVNDK